MVSVFTPHEKLQDWGFANKNLLPSFSTRVCRRDWTIGRPFPLSYLTGFLRQNLSRTLVVEWLLLVLIWFHYGGHLFTSQ